MDTAYDHIAEQAYVDRAQTPTPQTTNNTTATTSESNDSTSATTTYPSSPPRQNLQTEFQETFRAFSNSAWGAKLGGFWATARKQGETYYEEARKEVEDLSKDAVKEFENVRSRVGEVVVGATEAVAGTGGRNRSDTVKQSDITGKDSSLAASALEDGTGNNTENHAGQGRGVQGEEEDTETFIERFKTEAAKRLKDVQKAEDAADEALLRFGTNIANFLRDAVSVAAPTTSSSTDSSQPGQVLFESKDAMTGKRVIHTNRFDAQLHVIHTSIKSFTQDPDTDGGQWEEWRDGQFNVEEKTDAIALDLEKYSELRLAMEKLVPEQVDYKDFWTRYYFLRHVVEMQEEKRREMLKASANTEEQEEIGWDDDSDEEDAKQITTTSSTSNSKSTLGLTNDSSTTINKITMNDITTTTPTKKETQTGEEDEETTVTKEGRRSHDEKSVADSEASYDIVGGNGSGATSRSPGSPKDRDGKDSKRGVASVPTSTSTTKSGNTAAAAAAEDSDDDWE